MTIERGLREVRKGLSTNTTQVSDAERAREAWEVLCQRLQRDPATSEESDTCSLRAAWKAMLAFAALRDRPTEGGVEERIVSAVAQYRNAPFRSADWLAGELMVILDTVPANDTASFSADETTQVSPGVLEALDTALEQFSESMSSMNVHELGERLACDVAEIVDHARRRLALASLQAGEAAPVVEGKTVPRPPKGASIFAVNCTTGAWHYVNHAQTWQAMPNPLSTTPAKPDQTAQGVPEGWKLVPKVATPEMVNAAVVPLNRTGSVRSVWSAMISTSPHPEERES